MQRKAYAKINLGLRILRKREDGFHDIETIFTRIALADELSFSSSTSIELEQSGAALPSDESNLVIKAARALLAEYKPLRGAHITLRKNIPIGAGLGGGSSDAATTLRALNELWQMNLSVEALQKTALSLGSDIPYFMRDGSAFATGRGEQLTYFDIRIPYWIVTLSSGVPVSTAWAYQQIVPSGRAEGENARSQLLRALEKRERLEKLLTNDFEQPVFAHFPVVARDKEFLLAGGACFAQMSGSGSSVYGFFERENDARALLARVAETHTTSLTPPGFGGGHG